MKKFLRGLACLSLYVGCGYVVYTTYDLLFGIITFVSLTVLCLLKKSKYI